MRRIEPLAFTWTASSDGLVMRIGPCVLMGRGPGPIVPHRASARRLRRRQDFLEAPIRDEPHDHDQHIKEARDHWVNEGRRDRGGTNQHGYLPLEVVAQGLRQSRILLMR